MKINIFKNQIVKNILSMVAVAGFGFVLLNLTFLFDYFFQALISFLIKFFVPVEWLYKNTFWFPSVMHGLFMVVIGLISWRIFKSKLKVLFKATFLVVPVAVILVTFGIFFYQWPIIPQLLGGLFSFGLLYYFYRSKQPWIYYYAVILISLVLLIGGILGMEI